MYLMDWLKLIVTCYQTMTLMILDVSDHILYRQGVRLGVLGQVPGSVAAE